jgi:hypothetical protein
MTKEKQTKKSFFENRVFAVLFAIVVILIFYFVIKLIPLKNEEPAKLVNKEEVDSSLIFKKQGTLSFINNKGEVLSTIDIELADNYYKRMQGLMYRKEMAENQGMFFIFEIEDEQSFWMKNTILSLDILYVNVNREIVKIYKNTKPFSTESLPSLKPALYVVEVNAGYTDKYGIKEGDKISWVINN